MTKHKNEIVCSYEDLTDLKFNYRMVVLYLFSHKNGANCTSELKKHMSKITATLARYRVVVELTDNILQDGMLLNSIFMTVRGAAPSEKHITLGIAHV